MNEIRSGFHARTFDQLLRHQIVEPSEQADKSDEDFLSQDEFITLFHLLTRREDLFEVMQNYVENEYKTSIETIQMTVDELLSFLQNSQYQKIQLPEFKDLNREQAQQIIDKFENDSELRENGLLSFNGKYSCERLYRYFQP
ncbi:unnamed protein product [Rotaria sp. Silwood2]|nr:unnamed protein product [Rotaria sp. Silwood2]CAF3085542.1 unnamed protein product [Rotaria sp. Silwood2]CAF3941237.1 unnamed protein product [Rotaria sp. Silwood2]CAF4103151.1 unnamed protein product [Rotaria sp. Silwood2]CAF4395333.1 unnamed protein product [Rotaria sp. Silwood2]